MNRCLDVLNGFFSSFSMFTMNGYHLYRGEAEKPEAVMFFGLAVNEQLFKTAHPMAYGPPHVVKELTYNRCTHSVLQWLHNESYIKLVMALWMPKDRELELPESSRTVYAPRGDDSRTQYLLGLEDFGISLLALSDTRRWGSNTSMFMGYNEVVVANDLHIIKALSNGPIEEA